MTPSQRYADRVHHQSLAWAQGRPYHNQIDDECCPDFSCCMPALFTKDDDKRWQQYHQRHGRLN